MFRVKSSRAAQSYEIWREGTGWRDEDGRDGQTDREERGEGEGELSVRFGDTTQLAQLGYVLHNWGPYQAVWGTKIPARIVHEQTLKMASARQASGQLTGNCILGRGGQMQLEGVEKRTQGCKISASKTESAKVGKPARSGAIHRTRNSVGLMESAARPHRGRKRDGSDSARAILVPSQRRHRTRLGDILDF